jgi:hypothetical protein
MRDDGYGKQVRQAVFFLPHIVEGESHLLRSIVRASNG